MEKVREALVAGVFVAPFFWFRTAVSSVIMISSVILYDVLFDGSCVRPSLGLCHPSCNGFWHVWWTLVISGASSRAGQSILIWMDLYFILRYWSSEAVSRGRNGAAAADHRITCSHSSWLSSFLWSKATNSVDPPQAPESGNRHLPGIKEEKRA